TTLSASQSGMRRRARSSTHPGVRLIALGRCAAAKDIGESASTRTKSARLSILSQRASRWMLATVVSTPQVCRSFILCSYYGRQIKPEECEAPSGQDAVDTPGRHGRVPEHERDAATRRRRLIAGGARRAAVTRLIVGR